MILAKFEQKAMEKGLEKGREEGREEGREKGREEGKIEAARKLLAEGMKIEDIARILEINESDF